MIEFSQVMTGGAKSTMILSLEAVFSAISFVVFVFLIFEFLQHRLEYDVTCYGLPTI